MRIRPRFDSRAGPKSWEMSEPTVGRAKPQGRRRRNAVHHRDVLFERIGTVLGVDWTETFVSLGGWRPRRLTSCSSMVSSPTDKRSPEGVLDAKHQAGRKDGDHAA